MYVIPYWDLWPEVDNCTTRCPILEYVFFLTHIFFSRQNFQSNFIEFPCAINSQRSPVHTAWAFLFQSYIYYMHIHTDDLWIILCPCHASAVPQAASYSSYAFSLCVPSSPFLHCAFGIRYSGPTGESLYGYFVSPKWLPASNQATCPPPNVRVHCMFTLSAALNTRKPLFLFFYQQQVQW